MADTKKSFVQVLASHCRVPAFIVATERRKHLSQCLCETFDLDEDGCDNDIVVLTYSLTKWRCHVQ